MCFYEWQNLYHAHGDKARKAVDYRSYLTHDYIHAIIFICSTIRTYLLYILKSKLSQLTHRCSIRY